MKRERGDGKASKRDRVEYIHVSGKVPIFVVTLARASPLNRFFHCEHFHLFRLKSSSGWRVDQFTCPIGGHLHMPLFILFPLVVTR